MARRRSGGGAAAFDATKERSAGAISRRSQRRPVFHEPSRAPCRSCGWPVSVGTGSSPFGPTGSDLAWLLERFDAGFAMPRPLDRADLFRVAARLLRTRRDAAGADRAARRRDGGRRRARARRTRWCGAGDRDRGDGSTRRSRHDRALRRAWVQRSTNDRVAGPTDLGLLRRFLFNTSARNRPAALSTDRWSSFPRLERAANASRSRVASSSMRESGVAIRRDGDSRPHAAELLRSARARAAARRHRGVVRSRDEASASCRARISGATGVCRRAAVGGAVCRIPLARSGAGRASLAGLRFA